MPATATRTRRRSVSPALVASVVAIAASLAVLGLLPTGGETDEAPEPAPPAADGGRLFAPGSVWNKPLPDDAPLDESSEELAGALAERVSYELAEGIGPWIATWEYSTPIYRVPKGAPTVKVTLDDPEAGWRRSLQQAFERVPIPKGAKAAPGTDQHLTVWQPSTDRLWEFWHARREEDGWHASWGGAIRGVSKSPGYYTDRSWPGSAPNWGASATSLPVAAGTMTVEELRRGRIDHALAIALPYPRKDEYAWPAQRTDGTSTEADSIPEGARLRIDPSLDLDQVEMPRVTRMMAEAAQRHGMIVRDRTGQALQFYAEDPHQFASNPYEGEDGLFEGREPRELLESFPWEHLQVVRMRLS